MLDFLKEFIVVILIGIYIVLIMGAIIFLFFNMSFADTLTASWYSVESCQREGTSGIMANGRRLNDAEYTAASWDYPFGTMLEVTNIKTGKMVRVEVTDRGPARKLYRNGRILDLSRAAFAKIADLKEGVIPINIERSN